SDLQYFSELVRVEVVGLDGRCEATERSGPILTARKECIDQGLATCGSQGGEAVLQEAEADHEVVGAADSKVACREAFECGNRQFARLLTMLAKPGPGAASQRRTAKATPAAECHTVVRVCQERQQCERLLSERSVQRLGISVERLLVEEAMAE